MNKVLIILSLGFLGLSSCHEYKNQKTATPAEKSALLQIITPDYTLYKPNKAIEAVLVLFGGYPENATDMEREFKILDLAEENNIAVIFSNFNQKLWLEEEDKHQLAKNLQAVFMEHQLPVDNIYIGRFSSGGVISLLISNFIIGMKQFYIDPKGVFIVDAPIDLEALFWASEKNIKRNFTASSVQESRWLLKTLATNLGNPKNHLHEYESRSVFTYSTDNIANLSRLKHTRIRLYTKPDSIWWKEHRMADQDQTNAFYIHKWYESLKRNGFEKAAYIPTQKKGYRADGSRYPHSWAIVDKKDLISWMMKK